MNSDLNRSYRKKLMSNGLIYLGGEELAITLKDLSLTGASAYLKVNETTREAKDIFNMLSASAMIDFFLPEMHLAGDAEVVRVDIFDKHILIAFDFKKFSYDIDNQFYKRKVYRKQLQTPGKILLNGEHHEFITLNVSVDGLMISLTNIIVINQGLITVFELELLGLEGEVKVVWVENTTDGRTLLGLQYVNMEETVISGIPRFAQ